MIKRKNSLFNMVSVMNNNKRLFILHVDYTIYMVGKG